MIRSRSHRIKQKQAKEPHRSFGCRANFKKQNSLQNKKGKSETAKG